MPIVVCSCFAVEDNRILFVKEVKTEAAGKYGLPGGQLESNETLRECAAREFQEETGLFITINALIAISQKPLSRMGANVIRFFYQGTIDTTGTHAAELETEWLDLKSIRDLAA